MPNWHLDAICHQLDRVRAGEVRRLIIEVPPRSLKSILASVLFPAYCLGRDPTAKIITASYSLDLAAKHANDCRAVMRSDRYRRLFPATAIGSGKDTETDFHTSQRGYRYSTSPSGTLTGRGGDLLKRYDKLPVRHDMRIIQSWDIGMKAGEGSDWSVCTTWMKDRSDYYLLDVERGRWDFPTLQRRVIEHARKFHADGVLIEDMVTGTALIVDHVDDQVSFIGMSANRRIDLGSLAGRARMVGQKGEGLLQAVLIAFSHGFAELRDAS